jgi:HNH endonuclease/AP2 domain
VKKTLVKDGHRVTVYADGSIEKTTQGHNWKRPKTRILKGSVIGRGYVQVRVGGMLCYVHRLVAEAFIPNPEGKPCVNHKDGNKKNNAASNLEWVTYSENHEHAYRVLGRKTSAGQSRGGGVCYDKSRDRWMSYLDRHGKRKYLGYFSTEDEARAARTAAEQRGGG